VIEDAFIASRWTGLFPDIAFWLRNAVGYSLWVGPDGIAPSSLFGKTATYECQTPRPQNIVMSLRRCVDPC
jgi:hypothetical protein